MNMRLLLLCTVFVSSAALIAMQPHQNHEKEELCNAVVHLEELIIDYTVHEDASFLNAVDEVTDNLYKYIDKGKYEYNRITKAINVLRNVLSGRNNNGVYNELLKYLNYFDKLVDSLMVDESWIVEAATPRAHTSRGVFVVDEDIEDDEFLIENEKRVRAEIQKKQEEYLQRKKRAELKKQQNELKKQLMHPVSYDPKKDTEYHFFKQAIENCPNAIPALFTRQ